MKWQEFCFTPCARGLCHFSSSKTHCKSSHRGWMQSDWQSKGTETSVWQNEVNCVTKAFPTSSVSRAKGMVRTTLPICQKEFAQRGCQQSKPKLCSTALPSKSSSIVTGNQTLAKNCHLYTKGGKKRIETHCWERVQCHLWVVIHQEILPSQRILELAVANFKHNDPLHILMCVQVQNIPVTYHEAKRYTNKKNPNAYICFFLSGSSALWRIPWTGIWAH